MDKIYQPKNIEAKWAQFWEENQYGKPSGNGQPFCIMIPPPNVTGSLHMGHGFQYTLMDILIRAHKQRGYNTLWQVGTDHAGIATQMLVERNLALKGIDRKDMSREAFVEKIWEWKEHSGTTITTQMRRMGILVDWDRERFTMDEGLSKAVNTVFCELFKQGLIYQGTRLVNWDTKLKTAVSDLEINNVPHQGKLFTIAYPLADGSGQLEIATTRPETMFADSAIAVHPDDQRHQSLIGKYALIPITNRRIPIIADNYVDPEFGSGCVKITPAHDFNDYEVGKRHQLEMPTLFTTDGKLNELAPASLQGLTIKAAREALITELTELSLLIQTEDHTMSLPMGDRSGTVLEPRLTKQWFMKMQEMATEALTAAQKEDIKFHPQNWVNTYNHWLENITDWCISRQIWWGHRIPAWYDEKGRVYVGESVEDVRKEHHLTDTDVLTQDTDVLDTWFSSALWPFSTLNWPEKNPDLDAFYPSNVMVTGFDIIFFWVARMIMMGQKFMGDIPFKDIYITGLIRDFRGEKMSKSKGNVLNPIDVMDGIELERLIINRTENLMQPDLKNKIKQLTKKEFPAGIPGYGTDALRYTFCALASTGRDIKFDISRLEGYRNFCNKIWNAARFIILLSSQTPGKDHGIQIECSHWIQAQVARLKENHEELLKTYRFDLIAKDLHHGFWHDFCDWYIELAKVTYESTNDPKIKAQLTHDLQHTLFQYLYLLHPIIPFITEEIFSQMQNQHSSLLNFPYPEPLHSKNDNLIIESTHTLISWTNQIRTMRSELGIKPSAWLEFQSTQGLEHPQLELFLTLTKLKPSSIAPDTVLKTNLGETQILINLKDQIDITKESLRLNKQLGKLQNECTKLKQKLENPNYSQKAPADLLERDKQRIIQLEGQIEKNKQYIDALE